MFEVQVRLQCRTLLAVKACSALVGKVTLEGHWIFTWGRFGIGDFPLLQLLVLGGVVPQFQFSERNTTEEPIRKAAIPPLQPSRRWQSRRSDTQASTDHLWSLYSCESRAWTPSWFNESPLYSGLTCSTCCGRGLEESGAGSCGMRHSPLSFITVDLHHAGEFLVRTAGGRAR